MLKLLGGLDQITLLCLLYFYFVCCLLGNQLNGTKLIIIIFNADEDEDFGAPLHLCDQTEMSASENL